MQPFAPKLNRDGLADGYTTTHYTYAPSAAECTNSDACRSKYLFCDVARGRCRARIQAGGRCAKYATKSKDACYESTCDANTGICNGYSQPEEHVVTDTAHNTADELVWIKVMLIELNTTTANKRAQVYVETANRTRAYSPIDTAEFIEYEVCVCTRRQHT